MEIIEELKLNLTEVIKKKEDKVDNNRLNQIFENLSKINFNGAEKEVLYKHNTTLKDLLFRENSIGTNDLIYEEIENSLIFDLYKNGMNIFSINSKSNFKNNFNKKNVDNLEDNLFLKMMEVLPENQNILSQEQPYNNQEYTVAQKMANISTLKSIKNDLMKKGSPDEIIDFFNNLPTYPWKNNMNLLTIIQNINFHSVINGNVFKEVGRDITGRNAVAKTSAKLKFVFEHIFTDPINSTEETFVKHSEVFNKDVANAIFDELMKDSGFLEDKNILETLELYEKKSVLYGGSEKLKLFFKYNQDKIKNLRKQNKTNKKSKKKTESTINKR
jgi:hypothetical protein